MSRQLKNFILIPAGIFLAALLLAVLLPVSLNGHTVSQTVYDLLIRTRKENEYLELENLYVDGVPATECKSEAWFLCTLKSLPENGEVLHPEITVNTGDSSRYCVIRSTDVTRESIEKNEPILLSVYTLRGYKQYRLHFTTLPIMTLDSEGDILREDTEVSFNGLKGSAHTRGTSSRIFTKRSYKISLDGKAEFLDLRTDDDWILSSLYNDPERVRNVFNSELWEKSCAGFNSFGTHNGYEMRLVELFLNGDYRGLYALGYKPDQKEFGIQEGEEFLYSKTEWEEGAYELQGGKTEKNSEKAWEAIKGTFQSDKASSINLWLFTNFCAGADNNGKNYFIALKKSKKDGYSAVYCPWDLDMTWGNEYNCTAQNYVDVYTVSTDTPFEMKEGPIFEKLRDNDGKTIRKLQERYEELRNGFWSDKNLNAMIDIYENQIFGSGAYRRDISLFPESTQQDPENQLNTFREYVLTRASWMDDYMENLK